MQGWGDLKMSRLRHQILSEVLAFAETTGLSDSRIGLAAVNDAHLVRRLRLGYGTQLCTLERLETWMSAEMERRTEAVEAA